MKRALLIYDHRYANDRVFKAQLTCFLSEGLDSGIEFVPEDNLHAYERFVKEGKKFDFAFFMNPDLQIASLFAASAFPAYNGLFVQNGTKDRAIMHALLEEQKLPVTPSFGMRLTGGEALLDFNSILRQMEEQHVSFPLEASDCEVLSPLSKAVIQTPVELMRLFERNQKTRFFFSTYLPGRHLLAYVIGKKCHLILERVYKKEKRNSVDVPYLVESEEQDNRFIKRTAVQAVRAVGGRFGVVHLLLVGKSPLVYAVDPYMKTISAESLTKYPLTIQLLEYCSAQYKDLSRLAECPYALIHY
jgi:hypothetical protein